MRLRQAGDVGALRLRKGVYIAFAESDRAIGRHRHREFVRSVLKPSQRVHTPCAQQLAEEIASKPFLTRRYSRVVLIRRIKKIMQEDLELGLALEGLAALDANPLADEGVAG